MAALTVGIEFAVERQAAESLTPPKVQTVSDWAEENIVLEVSQEPGRLRIPRTPYARRILDAVGDPAVKRITLMTATQVAKTTIQMCALAYAIDQAPGDALFVLPTEDLCRNFSKGRLGKLLRGTQSIRRVMTGDASDLSMFRYAFTSMTLYLAWAQSPAMLSSNPVRYVFMDETGKFPAYSGHEADPTKLATERCKNFWNRKVIEASSPTRSGDYISREFMAGSQEYYHVPCPHCGMKQTFVFTQIKWPDGEWDANRTRSKRLAWYECAVCSGRILDHHKRRMLMDGEWIAKNPGGDHLSFHLNSIYSPWLTFSDVAAEFQECRNRPELLMNFTNSWLGEVWYEKAEEVSTDAVEKLRGAYMSGLMPAEAVALFAGADVQKDGVYWEVRAFGYGDAGLPSWLVDWGYIKRPDDRSSADIEGLHEAVLAKVYPSVDGNTNWAVRTLLVDSGYRTQEVYAFAHKYPERVKATKGASTKPATPLTWNRIDRDRRGKVLKWSQLVGIVDTEFFKDMVHARRTCQPGLWHLPANVTKEYVAQASAEHKVIERDTKGRAKESWQIRPDAGDNHWWDTGVLTFVAAFHHGAHNSKAVRKGPTVAAAKKEESQKRPFVQRHKSSGGRGGFVSRGR